MKGVNGALQERMNVLDVDFDRATQLPVDYDTDVESEWSNLSMRSCFSYLLFDSFV